MAMTVHHFVNVFQDSASGGPLGTLPGCITQEYHVRVPKFFDSRRDFSCTFRMSVLLHLPCYGPPSVKVV